MTPPIPLVRALTSALGQAGVDYCHWKSTSGIGAALLGETDLDLLVARRHLREFAQAIGALGFVEMERRVGPQVPGITHFFGYDVTADRFVHIHAHYELVVGHDRTKNYRLPIEGPYLESVSNDGLFPIPSPEFEYVVFIIRMVLKWAIWDEVLWEAIRGRRARMRPSERTELASLGDVIDSAAVTAIVKEHLPSIGVALFHRAEKVVTGKAPVWARVKVARALESSLSSNARLRQSGDALLRIWRRVSLVLRRRAGARPTYRLRGSGAIVAIMGGDGAGKSTALDGLDKWLGGSFDVVRIHLGKPPWSATTYVVRGGLKVAALLGVGPDELEGGKGGGGALVDPRRLVWFACKARDRYLAYRKARRAANRGSIVLSDRFPHPALRRMDVPQIERLTGGSWRGPFLTWLASVERHYHTLVGLPEVAVVLRLDPEEAGRRKADEPFDYVVERSREVWEIDWRGSGVHVIDAGRSSEIVLADLKEIIWASLQ